MRMIKMYNKEIEKFGGYLKCEVCGHELPLDHTVEYLTSGWPRCCGYTMRWITKMN
jgi:hypothetical protein